MSPAVFLTVFAVTFVAELPDKSLFASLVLGTRYRALWVWLGVTAAFAVHVTIAVVAGGLLNLLPHRLVLAIVALLFAAGSIYLLFGSEEDTKSEGEEEVEAAMSAHSGRGARTAILTSFGVIFVGEFGDITQIATANFAARYDDELAGGLARRVPGSQPRLRPRDHGRPQPAQGRPGNACPAGSRRCARAARGPHAGRARPRLTDRSGGLSRTGRGGQPLPRPR